MKIYRYEESEYIVNNIDTPSIFLAGPTVRGNQPHKAGPDIIVIWPMTTLPPRDSIRIPITIHQVLGIEGLTKNKYYLDAIEECGGCGS